MSEAKVAITKATSSLQTTNEYLSKVLPVKAQVQIFQALHTCMPTKILKKMKNCGNDNLSEYKKTIASHPVPITSSASYEIPALVDPPEDIETEPEILPVSEANIDNLSLSQQKEDITESEQEAIESEPRPLSSSKESDDQSPSHAAYSKIEEDSSHLEESSSDTESRKDNESEKKRKND